MQKSEKSFVVNLLVCWSEWSWGAPHRLVRKQKCWKHHSKIREFLRVYTWCIHAIKVHTCLVVKAGQSQREIISASWCVKLLNETSILDSHVNFILLCDSSFFPLPYSLKSWWRPTPPLSTSLKWAKRPLFGVRNKNHGFMHSSRYDLLCLCFFCLSSGFHDMSKKKNLIHEKTPTWLKCDRCLYPQPFDCLPLQILNLSEEVTLCPLAPVHLWLTLTLQFLSKVRSFNLSFNFENLAGNSLPATCRIWWVGQVVRWRLCWYA